MSKVVKIEGKYLGASGVKEVGEKKTRIRSFWIDITEDESYGSNTPEFQLMGDRVSLPEQVGVEKGDNCRISFVLEGRKYKDKDQKDKVATNIKAIKIEKVKVEYQGAPSVDIPVAVAGVDEDLPF